LLLVSGRVSKLLSAEVLDLHQYVNGITVIASRVVRTQEVDDEAGHAHELLLRLIDIL